MLSREEKVLEIWAEEGKYFINAPQVGIEVEVEREEVIVMISPRMVSTACGLCAHVPKVPVASKWMRELLPTTSIYAPVHKFIVKSEECERGYTIPSAHSSCK